MILADNGTIGERHLRLSPGGPGTDLGPAPSPPGHEETLEEVRERAARGAERLWLLRALERAKGDRTAAAAKAGLTSRRFEAKLREHGLDP